MENGSNNMEPLIPHPDENNPIRVPYVPLAQAKQMMTIMFGCIIGLVVISILLTVGFLTSINRKPWVLANLGDGYREVGISHHKITRKETERYLNFVIPSIYGYINGQAPGLKEIRGLLNENIIQEQQKALGSESTYLKGEGISQFAIITGVNPETLVIDREKKRIYAEVLGTIVLTKENKTQKTDVQWRCIIYIVEPTSALSSSTIAGKMNGNRMGLFLQQIEEQIPGTINKDSLKPSGTDIQEKEADKDEDNPPAKK